FANSPFYVQRELADWKRTAHPRRVGVSSFGAGGSNAHLILEEYAQEQETSGASQPELFVLSAKSSDALRRYAERIASFLGEATDLSLANLTWTSQLGRTPMDARLAIVASSVDELRGKLTGWIAAGETDGVFHGSVKQAEYSGLIEGAAGKAFLDALLTNRELEKIARLWVLGAAVDWTRMSRAARPRKVSLPTYPFAKERCWIDLPAAPVRVAATPVAATPVAATPAKQRVQYVPRWIARSLTARGAIGPVLLLDSSDELLAGLQQLGTSVVRVQPGTVAFDALVDELKPSLVVHRSAKDEQEVDHQLQNGLYSLFALAKALLRAKQPARIVSISSGSPLDTAIAGFLRTLTLEAPAYRTKVVEADTVQTIVDELADADWSDQEIRYRDDVREVRVLVPAATRLTQPLPLKQRGVYLITGGMGGLGLVFADYLAKNFQAKLVLAGRTIRPSDAIERLKTYGAEVLTLQADVRNFDDVAAVVREAKARFSRIDGVIHAAGVTRDALLVRKTREEMEAVLAPKVYGTLNLDRATRGEELDFFALFSSVAGVFGNAGQCDYAFGNRFLDAFAEQRAGRTISFDWPLWEEGGMTVSRDQIALLEKETGIAPLPAEEGLRQFEAMLCSDVVQSVVLYGTASKIAAFVDRKPVPAQRPVAAQSFDAAALVARTEEYLKAVVGEEIRLDPERIGSTDPLESFGLDSVTVNHLNARLEQELGELPKTLLYENETIREVASYLVRHVREALVARFGSTESEPQVVLAQLAEAVVPAADGPAVEATDNVVRYEVLPAREREAIEAIAIVGVHGYYPRSADLQEYWQNLKQGRDLVDVVPASRWDYEELYHPDPAAAADGKIYCKWGAFLDNHDQFDPHFFKISTAEARLIDPQERLFLESVWAAIEDAGYTRDRLRARFPKAGSADVGVFVGVTTNSYSLWAPEERTRGNFVSPTAMPWSIANRVSYFFDFNGPSLPVDTACSSSLVAIHLACESLRNRECQVAIAGGVNLYLHPSKYQSLCQKRMLSLDGKCHSYGAGDDGFVPGEGVGTVVLKPLSEALADGDRVYAVIRASAFDHSGRSNGYSAPNPNAQANLIQRTLEKAHIHPETIGYVEGHGTGT
ncbi:MAG TPA: SDR family NAD(P)-dependent oxidoreductase, partial [Thermoanaerobaculia bacterium]